MKTLRKIEISEDLDKQINDGMKVSGLPKADVVQEALRISLPQLVARFQSTPRWLEQRIREALTEEPETVSPARFSKNMRAIADGY